MKKRLVSFISVVLDEFLENGNIYTKSYFEIAKSQKENTEYTSLFNEHRVKQDKVIAYEALFYSESRKY